MWRAEYLHHYAHFFSISQEMDSFPMFSWDTDSIKYNCSITVMKLKVPPTEILKKTTPGSHHTIEGLSYTSLF